MRLGATTAGIDFALTRGGRIEGVVLDASTSAPLADVSVEVLRASGSTVASAFTDSAGHYSARGLATGAYYVRTRNHAGYLDELHDDVPCDGGSCSLSQGTAVVVTAARDTTGVGFRLTPGGPAAAS